MPLSPDSLLTKLFDAPVHPGEVRWIGVRPARRAPMVAVDNAALEEGRGLLRDHYARLGGKRQVTLIAMESLAAIASYLRRDAIEPHDIRRNIVVGGLNLLALKDAVFRVGDALLETTGECHPCSRMEDVFGRGGYNAVRGHGGITARVLSGGMVRIGDPIVRVRREAGGR